MQLSRQNMLDRSKCVKNAGGSQFELVLAASARARQIAEEVKRSGTKVHHNVVMDALLEIQSGKFS
jgi:DNA-directed RNA polymerase subunit K/omega